MDRKRPGILRRLGRLVATIVTIAFLIGYAGRYVEPSAMLWWVQLVAIPLPYIAALAAAIAVVRLLRGKGAMQRTLAIAVLVLIVVRFYPFKMGWGNGSSTSHNPESEFSVLSYNIPAERVRIHPEGSEQLLALVKKTDATVVCLQESYWNYRVGDQRPSGRGDVGNLEALGFDLSPPVNRTFGSEQVTITTLPNSSVTYSQKPSEPRDPDVLAILRSTIEWQQREFAVFNIHLASYGTSKPWQEQNRLSPRVWVRYLRDYRFGILHRAWQVEQVLEIIGAEALPFLVVGDFNATPHNWSYWRLAKDLVDTFEVAGTGNGFTYHERQPTFRIDFILVTDDFEPTSARALVGGVSDHRAVNATLRWRTPTQTN